MTFLDILQQAVRWLRQRRSADVVTLIVVATLLVACSTEKNTAQSRRWHSFLAKYNTYYNGSLAYIDASVEKENGSVLIDLSNYFTAAPILENGVLQTSKADKAHHGLGVRSMRYVTDLYGGTIDFEVDDDMFHLSVTFPENAERKEAAV